MQVHILRHGQTEFNLRGIVQGSGIDSDLNDTGQAQARSFFEAYQHLDFQLVVTSHLRRTHQTVQGFIDRKIPWLQQPDIREMNWGSHEGLSTTPAHMAAYDEVIRHWQAGNLDAALGGGESAREMGERLQRFVDWMRTRPAERLLVCSHGRALRGLITLMKGLPMSQMEGVRHANTAAYIARLVDGKFVFEVENDISHLG